MSEQKAPFTMHLEELRKRLIVTFLTVTTAFLVCFNYSEMLYRWLVKPMRENLVLSLQEPYLSFVPREIVHELVFLAPAEAFWMHMKVSLIAGLVISMPVVFWQVWRFMSPGLHKSEKRMAIPFVFVTSLLFLLGTAFCFIIVLPFAMNFLLNFRTESLTPMISVERYVDFCLKFIIAFGVIFELPVVMVFLSRMGVVTPGWLASNRKYAVLAAFIVAALLTPTPDAFNQTLMAVPIMVLYEGGIWSARLFGRRKGASDEADEKDNATGNEDPE
ncbi:twin-arginine translocase subunit TatC [Nitrospirota bacterium]